MDQPSPRDDTYCSNCGERITRQANYCHYCGKRLGEQGADHAGAAGGGGPGGAVGDRMNGGGSALGEPSRLPDGPAGVAGVDDDLGPSESPLRTVGTAAGIGILGIVLLALISVVVVLVSSPLGLSAGVLLVVGTAIGQYVGFGGLALGYLRRRGFTWEQVRSYVGVRIPSLREIGVVVAGYLAIVVLLVIVAGIASMFLPEPAENEATGVAADNPGIVPGMVLMMFLVVGPMEELLFRGIIQNRIRERLDAIPAIVIASAIFATVHVVALAGDPSGMLVTVFILFFPATVFGAVYEYTGNVVVPALLHAIHNSVIVSLIFLSPDVGDGEAILSVLVALAPL
jgi:membrane protease YdiL (CAAX protease family)